jgi:hypothetical protein
MKFFPSLFPGWLSSGIHLSPSTWEFTTSEGVEFDAFFAAGGKGSIYVKDSTDPDQIVHELLYAGLGLTTSKGPIPFGIGASFSTPDMFSEGVGPIMLAPGRRALSAKDFGGLGVILSFSIGVGIGQNRTIILFGAPPLFTVAAGRMRGEAYIPPTVGFTAMTVIFTVDP